MAATDVTEEETEQRSYAIFNPILSRMRGADIEGIFAKHAVFTTITYAQSLDGFIGGVGSRPITLSGPQSMVLTHSLRASHDAIMVGVGTVIADNPRLTARLVKTGPDGSQPPKSPRPVILDTRLRTPLTSSILSRSPIIFASNESEGLGEKKEALEAAGAVVELVPTREAGRLDLDSVLLRMAAEPYCIRSLMVEGGSRIIQDFICHARHLVDLVTVTISPQYLGSGVHVVQGDMDSHTAGDFHKNPPSKTPAKLVDVSYHQFGEDVVLFGRLSK